MKSVVLVCCLLAASAGLPSPAHSSTDPFAEFRIPEHSWSSGSAGAGFAGRRNQDDYGATSLRQRSLSSDVKGALSMGWDSDALLYSYGLTAGGDVDAAWRDTRTGGVASSWKQQDVSQEGREFWRLEGQARAYPWDSPVGVGLTGTLYGTYYQFWGRTDQMVNDDVLARRDESRRNDAQHRYDTTAGIQATLGVGRVRDATVVDVVHVLEQRLLEIGALARPLSAAARARLAALHYVAPYFSQAHDRPDRFVWREIERILADDGALVSQGLDAYSVMRALEPVPYRPLRQVGTFAGAVVSAATDHLIQREESQIDSRSYEDGVLMGGLRASSGNRFVYSSDAVWGGGQVEAHRPLGWRWQVDGSARAVRPLRPGESGLEVTSSLDAAWYVADRWEADAHVAQHRLYFDPRDDDRQPRTDSWLVECGVRASYYLEDRTRIDVTVAEIQSRSVPTGYRQYYRDTSTRISITRRLWGRMDAPGLVGPVRPID